jgi:hypothetical protein
MKMKSKVETLAAVAGPRRPAAAMTGTFPT